MCWACRAAEERLLHAVLDAGDDACRQAPGDLLGHIESRAERFHRASELVSVFAVLLIGNLAPEAPLHDRFLTRRRAAVDAVAEFIRRQQQAARCRTELDPAVKAVEFVQAGLARRTWPEELHRVDDIPRTASGRIQKFRLRQDLAVRAEHA
ncbi:hypothetical protein ACFYR1_19480 [Streptomyces canus]|uniref:hypothetical protein n=1 Tax=Streptomyces canus TaxID=58343 RepID=UPI003686ACCC